MLINKDYFPLVVEGLGKRVKYIGCLQNMRNACMRIVNLVFIILGMRLLTLKTDFINTTMLFLDIYT